MRQEDYFQNDSRLLNHLKNTFDDMGLPEEAVQGAFEKLKAKRDEEAKEMVLLKLEKIIRLIKADDYKALSEHIEYSPGGDDMGLDNYYIKMGDLLEDIGEFMDYVLPDDGYDR